MAAAAFAGAGGDIEKAGWRRRGGRDGGGRASAGTGFETVRGWKCCWWYENGNGGEGRRRSRRVCFPLFLSYELPLARPRLHNPQKGKEGWRAARRESSVPLSKVVIENP